MSARAALREGTAGAHERVDALFSRFDMTDREGYRAFLIAQATGFLPVETALDEAGAATVIPDWPERRRGGLLRADLADLSVTAPELLDPPPHFPVKASMLGAIYVLEGSRLGGAVLKRAVPDAFPRRFLEARQAAGSWRRLLESLDLFLIRPDDLAAAVQMAAQVFALFEKGARAQLGE